MEDPITDEKGRGHFTWGHWNRRHDDWLGLGAADIDQLPQ